MPPISTLFPYTTLFRSRGRRMGGPGVQHSLRPGHRQRYQSSQRETWLDDEPVEESAEATIRGQLGLSAHRRSEEHTSELQSRGHLVCRLLLEKKKKQSG